MEGPARVQTHYTSPAKSGKLPHGQHGSQIKLTEFKKLDLEKLLRNFENPTIYKELFG